MRLQAQDILKARKAGRSWTEISQQFGLSVSNAKAILAPIKEQARRNLSRRPESADRSPLTEFCSCGHIFRDHGHYADHSGPCITCALSDDDEQCEYFERAPHPHVRMFRAIGIYPARKPMEKGQENATVICPACDGLKPYPKLRGPKSRKRRCDDLFHENSLKFPW